MFNSLMVYVGVVLGSLFLGLILATWIYFNNKSTFLAIFHFSLYRFFNLIIKMLFDKLIFYLTNLLIALDEVKFIKWTDVSQFKL